MTLEIHWWTHISSILVGPISWQMNTTPQHHSYCYFCILLFIFETCDHIFSFNCAVLQRCTTATNKPLISLSAMCNLLTFLSGRARCVCLSLSVGEINSMNCSCWHTTNYYQSWSSGWKACFHSRLLPLQLLVSWAHTGGGGACRILSNDGISLHRQVNKWEFFALWSV